MSITSACLIAKTILAISRRKTSLVAVGVGRATKFRGNPSPCWWKQIEHRKHEQAPPEAENIVEACVDRAEIEDVEVVDPLGDRNLDTVDADHTPKGDSHHSDVALHVNLTMFMKDMKNMDRQPQPPRRTSQSP